jgi:regulatory protein YycI of two-component signal transduction system YycFG
MNEQFGTLDLSESSHRLPLETLSSTMSAVLNALWYYSLVLETKIGLNKVVWCLTVVRTGSHNIRKEQTCPRNTNCDIVNIGI